MATSKKRNPREEDADDGSLDISISARTRSKSKSKSKSESASDTATVLVTPRQDAFNAQTWWLVDLTPPGGSSSQGASALVKRCMTAFGWDETKARKVLRAYYQFIMLKKELKDWEEEQRVHPCFLVKQMWLCHIADVVNYCHDMMLLCGRVVGPNPDADGALDYAAKLKRDQTTRNLLQERFGVDYDEKVWGRSMEAELKKSTNEKALAFLDSLDSLLDRCEMDVKTA
jgi:hypothetical protein